MIRIFTSQERSVIIMLSSLLILGLAVKTVKDYYYTGTENLTLVGTNDQVVDFYYQLNEKVIDLAGIGVKQQKKILINGMNWEDVMP